MIREFFDAKTVREIVDEHTTYDAIRLLHYKHRLDELALVPKIDDALRFYAAVSSSIEQSMSILTNIERQLAAHNIFLSEKAERRLQTTYSAPQQ